MNGARTKVHRGMLKLREGFEKPHFDTCGSPQGVIGADTLSFNAKVDLVNF